MAQYRIIWSIDIEADSPEQAAHQARQYQLDPDSTATVFAVTDADTGQEQVVDLIDCIV
jgi:hypothetical protein